LRPELGTVLRRKWKREEEEGFCREAKHLSATWPGVLSASGDVNRGT